jgi:sterol desaturase/sphingolipid hydroxylase (fatty acid hydroxylase superfamily)
VKIGRVTSALILFGPTCVFLYGSAAAARTPWALLYILVGAGLLNGTAVFLLSWSERHWPANFAMRKEQQVTEALRENAFKVIGLTYLSAAIAWFLGKWLHGVSGMALLPEREWIVFQAIGALFIIDFWDYWAHRLQHRWNWLWARHAIHHSVKEFSLFGAAKISWLDTPFVVFPGFLMLGAIGVGPIASAVTMIAWFALTTMLHANADLSLGMLDAVIQVPAVHHRHHEIGFENAVAFGGVFCFFDSWFGTGTRRGDFAKTVGIGPRHP